MGDMIVEPHSKYHQQTRYSAYDGCACTVCNITWRCDGDEACKGSIQAKGNVRLAIPDPGEKHTYDRRHRRRDRCRQKNGSHGGHICRCRSVKPIPAKPENEHAQRSDDQVMAGKCVYFADLPLLILLELANPWSKHPGSDEGTDAADHVDAVGSRVIMKAPLRQKSASPGPVCFNWVYYCGDHS